MVEGSQASDDAAARLGHSRARCGLLYLLLAHHPPCQLSRTFRWSVCGRTIYVCARCLGEWVGFALVLSWGLGRLPTDTKWVQALLLYALLPLPAAVDWTTQTLGWRESSNLIRAVTGLLYGLALGHYIVSLLSRDWLVVGLASGVFALYLIAFSFVVYRPGVASNYLRPYEDFVYEEWVIRH